MSGSTINVKNSANQNLDTPYSAAGDGFLKLAVGSKDIAGDTETAAWQGVATHVDAGTWTAGDGVVIGAGVEAGGTAIHKFATDSAGNQIIVNRPTGGNPVDADDLAILSGGDAQDLFAANLTRKYLLVQNQSAGPLWIDFGVDAVAAPPSIKIDVGEAFVMEAGAVFTSSVSIIGATLDQAFAAKEL